MGNLFNSLLNSAWGDYFKNIGLKDDALKAAQSTFGVVETVLWIVLGVVGALGAIYAVYLGVKLARAEDQSKRDEAKKHLITVVIAIAITLVLIIFFNLLLPLIMGAINGVKEDDVTPKEFINPLLHMMRLK